MSTIGSHRGARLTIELGEAIIKYSQGDDTDAMTLGVSVLGYVCRRLDGKLPTSIVEEFINKYPTIASVRASAAKDIGGE